MRTRDLHNPIGVGLTHSGKMSEDEIKNALRVSDAIMSRIFEDTLVGLIDRGFLRWSDLPELSREVIDKRRDLRDKLHEIK